MEPGTNLPDVNRWLAYGRADAGELSLGLGNGLPQLSPAAVGLVDLPPVYIEAFLLKLQQRLVPLRVGLTDLIPDHLKPETSLSPWRQPQGGTSTNSAANTADREAATYVELEEKRIARVELLLLVSHRATHRQEQSARRVKDQIRRRGREPTAARSRTGRRNHRWS